MRTVRFSPCTAWTRVVYCARMVRFTNLATSAAHALAQRTGEAARWFAAAPGRVNLIGDHVDYNGGIVAPFAIDRGVVLAAAPNQTSSWRCCSDHSGDPAHFDIGPGLEPGPPSWANVMRGVASGFTDRGIEVPGFDLHICSNLPVGAGLSSSAALAVATTVLVEGVTGHTLSLHERAELAREAEAVFMGTPCGLMDQLASAGGRDGRIMTIDFGAGDAVSWSTFPDELAVVIADSGVRRALNDGRYADRRAACAQAAQALGVSSLGSASRVAVASSPLDETLRRRARHVVTEIDRVRCALAALETGDAERCGALMNESHASLRDDFDVSGPALDRLVAIAQRIGRDGGVFGSRLTGAGFGGCTATLVSADRAGEAADRIQRIGVREVGPDVRTMIVRPSAGAKAWSTSAG